MRIRLGLLVATTTAVLAAVAPAAQAGWAPPQDLTTSGATTASTVTAAGPDGTAVVAWLTAGVVQAAVKPPGAGFGAPVTLGGGSSPQVAVDDQGRVLVAWNAGNAVGLAERPPGGTLAFTGTATPATGLTQLALAFNGAGRALLAVTTPTSRALVTRARGTTGFTTAWSTSTAGLTYSSLSVGGGPAGDTAWTAWTDKNGATLPTSRTLARQWTAGIGAGAEQLVATYTDTNNNAVPFPTVTTNAVDGARVVGGDHVSVLYRVKTNTSFFISTTTTIAIGGAAATGGTLGAVATLASTSGGGIVGIASMDLPGAAALPGGDAAFAVSSFATGTTPYTVTSAGRSGDTFSAPAAFVPATADVVTQAVVGALPQDRAQVVYTRGTTIESLLRTAAGVPDTGTQTVDAGAAGGTTSGLSVAGDAQGGLVAAWVQTAGGVSNVRTALYDETGPPATISGPTTAAVGTPVTFSVAGDRWSATSNAWTLSDGTALSGASVTHAFASPGTYTVRETGTDAGGNATSGTLTITVSAPPVATVPPPVVTVPPPAPRDVTKPALSKLRLSATRFAVAAKASKIAKKTRTRPARGTSIGFTLSEAATVTAALEKTRTGYRSGTKCVTKAPKGRPKRRCTLYAAAGRLTAPAKAGAGSIAFTGRVKARGLATGAYRLTLTAKDAAGNVSDPVRATFTIVHS